MKKAIFLLTLAACATTREGPATVRVVRDAWGIPHVYADSIEDAYWGEGYVEALDRPNQMDRMRRAARGRLAEKFGKDSLEADKKRLARGYTDAELETMWRGCDEFFRRVVESYCAGVNAALPGAAWSPLDCMAVGVMMARRFGESGEVERRLTFAHKTLQAAYPDGTGSAIFDDLLRMSDPAAPATLDDQLPTKLLGPQGRLDAEFDRLEDVEPILARHGIPIYAGSNAWVVAPKKSASGRAMLYGGPMMGFGTPSVCNEIHLVAPGFDTFGMSFLGAPGVLIGMTRRHAWTTTSGGSDMVDIFALEVNPLNPDEYKTARGWKAFEKVVHRIPVKDGEPVEFVVERTDFGPVVERDRQFAYAAKMSYWMREVDTFRGFIGFDWAASLEDFQKNVALVATSHNIFYADVDGRIGFWFAGRHPKRRAGHDPRFVQPIEMDWEGLLDFSEWPQSVDPPRGWFGNWNNKPGRTWEPTEWGKIFHGKKILESLQAKDKLTFEEFERIAFDTSNHEFLADYFLPFFLDAAKGRDEVKLFEGWDHMENGGARQALLHAWLDAVIDDVFKDEVFPMTQDRGSRKFLVNPLLYLLEGDRCHYKMKHDFLNGKRWRDVVVKALERAWADLSKKEPDPAKWTYESDRTVDFKADIGKVASVRDRGTYQMTVELGGRVETLCAPGQSEDPASPHYKDQLADFLAWRYKRVDLDPPAAGSVTIEVRR